MKIGEPRIKTKIKAYEPKLKQRAKDLPYFSLIKTHHDKYGLKRLVCGQAMFYNAVEYDKSYIESVRQIVSAYNRNQPVLFVLKLYPDGLDVMRVA